MPRRTVPISLWAVSLGLMLALPAAVAGQTGAADGEWHYYGGDAGGTRYAPLDQIDRARVLETNQRENRAEPCSRVVR